MPRPVVSASVVPAGLSYVRLVTRIGSPARARIAPDPLGRPKSSVRTFSHRRVSPASSRTVTRCGSGFAWPAFSRRSSTSCAAPGFVTQSDVYHSAPGPLARAEAGRTTSAA
jgi:hypothetical protein